MRRGTAYSRIVNTVYSGIAKECDETDPTVAGYMFARAALIHISAMRGSDKAAELAYRLADEFAAGLVLETK